jgi:hypothetical protein
MQNSPYVMCNQPMSWPNTIQIPSSPDNYKIHPCYNFFTYGYCPTSQKCHFYHNQSDRRRPPLSPDGSILYKPTFCPSLIMNGLCQSDDSCEYSHNSYEKNYHPFPMSQEFPKSLTGNSTNLFCSNFMIKEMDQSQEMLDIQHFKLNPCQIDVHHNQKHCINFHSEKDRRRDPKSYSSEKCQFMNGCPYGENCPYSHNSVEKLYHNEKYKTKFCNDYDQINSSCNYGGFCSFAHSEIEISIELIHNMKQDEEFFVFFFKTVWCPFNFEHNKALCLYAHNWQDFRRKPHLFEYTNIMCPNWRSDTFLCVYNDGCPLEANCRYCHGWKEQQYHPMDYKTKMCPEGKKCSRGGSSACPFYHTADDRRNPSKFGLNHYFPKNSSIKLHPYSNINDQKELFLKSNNKEMQIPKLLYASFYEDGDAAKKCSKYKSKSDSSNLNLSYVMKRTSPKLNMSTDSKSMLSNQTSPSIATESSDKVKPTNTIERFLLASKDTNWDESLFTILCHHQLTHLFYILNGHMKVNEINTFPISILKLANLGIGKEDISKLEDCASKACESSERSSTSFEPST